MQANLFGSADDGSGPGAEVVPLATSAPAVMFGRQRVPAPLVQDAMRALEHFNELTGRECRPFTARGKPSESLKRIIGAMLDHPEARVLWRRMIEHTLADPWWDGPPSTGVIFGPGVVEQSIARAHQRRVVPSSRHLTPTGHAIAKLLAAGDGIG